jgi:hypothetical protein
MKGWVRFRRSIVAQRASIRLLLGFLLLMLLTGCAGSRRHIVVTDVNTIPPGETLLFDGINMGNDLRR